MKLNIKEEIGCKVCAEKNNFSQQVIETRDWIYDYKELVKYVKCNSCSSYQQQPFPTGSDIKSFYPKNYYSINKPKNTTNNEYSGVLSSYFKFRNSLTRKALEINNSSSFSSHISRYILKKITQSYPTDIPKSIGSRMPSYLDVGCGKGDIVSLLSEIGWNAIGVDFIGEESNLIKIGNFLDMEFKLKFDFIRFSGVIEHLEDFNEYLNKIKNLLSADGLLVISTPSADSFIRKIFKKYWIGFEAPRHLIIFSKDGLSKACSRNGLEVIKVSSELSSGSLSHSLSNWLGLDISTYEKYLLYFLICSFPLDIIIKLMNGSTNLCYVTRRIQN